MDAHGAVGAGDGEAAVLELDVAFGGLQEMRGKLLALGDDLVADQDDGAAAHGGRARAAGAHAERHRIGVALDELHLLRIDAEPVHQHLRLQVAWPWPCEIEPVTKVIPPSGSKRISAVS